MRGKALPQRPTLIPRGYSGILKERGRGDGSKAIETAETARGVPFPMDLMLPILILLPYHSAIPFRGNRTTPPEGSRSILLPIDDYNRSAAVDRCLDDGLSADEGAGTGED
jgi:hypothetical protein